MPLLDDFMGAERLLQSLSVRLKQNDPRTSRLHFSQPSGRLLSLSFLRTKVFRSLIAYKTFYHLDLAQNFSYLALLAMQHDRLAFQNSFSVWTTYESNPYHVSVLLIHIVFEAAKTFGKSQESWEMEQER